MPAILIDEALVCPETVVVIAGAAGRLGAGGGGGDGDGDGAGGTKVVSTVGGATIDSELDCNDAAPAAFEFALLELVACIVSVDGNDELLSDGEKPIGRAPTGSSKLGFVVEPFCPGAVGPFIAVKPTEYV